MARQSNDKQGKGGNKGKKQEERELKANAGKRTRKTYKKPGPRRTTRSLNGVLTALKKKKGVGQAVIGGDIIVTKGALGTKLIGDVDYLKAVHGYAVHYVGAKQFAAAVKAKQVIPFTSLKVEGEDE